MCCGEKKKRPRDLRWRAAGVEEGRGFDGWDMCCGEKKKRPRDLRWRAAGVEEGRGFDGWECVRREEEETSGFEVEGSGSRGRQRI